MDVRWVDAQMRSHLQHLLDRRFHDRIVWDGGDECGEDVAVTACQYGEEVRVVRHDLGDWQHWLQVDIGIMPPLFVEEAVPKEVGPVRAAAKGSEEFDVLRPVMLVQ